MSINLANMRSYRQIWIMLKEQYSVDQIGETIELIIATNSQPAETEYSYPIWAAWCALQGEVDNGKAV